MYYAYQGWPSAPLLILPRASVLNRPPQRFIPLAFTIRNLDETEYEPITKAGRFLPPEGTRPEHLFVHYVPEKLDWKDGKPVEKPELEKDAAHPKPVYRIVSRTDTGEILIYTYGCCLNENVADPSRRNAGCALVYKPVSPSYPDGDYAFRLEDRGPKNSTMHPTTNLAQLRAAIAPLQQRQWVDDVHISTGPTRPTKITIATDSAYVVEGITDKVEAWEQKGFKIGPLGMTHGQLWKLLLERIRYWAERGVLVRFWLIDEEQNGTAKVLAGKAAKEQKGMLFDEVLLSLD